MQTRQNRLKTIEQYFFRKSQIAVIYWKQLKQLKGLRMHYNITAIYCKIVIRNAIGKFCYKNDSNCLQCKPMSSFFLCIYVYICWYTAWIREDTTGTQRSLWHLCRLSIRYHSSLQTLNTRLHKHLQSCLSDEMSSFFETPEGRICTYVYICWYTAYAFLL